MPDWYGNTPGYAIAGLGRVSTADNTITNGLSATGDPRLYEYRLTLAAANQSKLIQSISFNKSRCDGRYERIERNGHQCEPTVQRHPHGGRGCHHR